MKGTDRGILRPHQANISILQRLLDLLVIFASMACVVLIHGSYFDKEHVIATLLAILVFYVLSDLGQLYASWRGERIRQELRKVGGIWTASFTAVFFCDYFLVNMPFLEDSALLQWFSLVLFSLCSYRTLLRIILHALRRKGFNTRSVVIAGAGPLGQRLASNIASAPWMGLDLLGFFDDKQRDPVRLANSKIRLPVSGSLENLVEQARTGQIDRVYITLPMRSEAAH